MTKNEFEKWLHEQPRLMDGAMGSALFEKGLPLGVYPESYNLIQPQWIKEIHKAHLNSGSEIITANTFGANPLKFDNYVEIVKAAVDIAHQAIEEYREESDATREIYVALDLGPLGTLLSPLGTLSFDEAYEAYKKVVHAGVKAGCDLILLETFTDLYEAKCGVLAAVENSELPVICTMSFESTGRTFFGADIESMATTLEGLGISALGFNCSFGSREMLPLVEKLVKVTAKPIFLQPNAGMPQIIQSIAVYDTDFDEYYENALRFLASGVSAIGGCCGTTGEHIIKLKEAIKYYMDHSENADFISKYSAEISWRKAYLPKTRVASFSETVTIGDVPVIIGERLNPTGKKRLREALKNEEYDYLLREGLLQIEQGAAILDVNVGVPGIDEPLVMKEVIKGLQAIINAPLQIDSSNTDAIEAGARYYNGKPLINSVSGKLSVLEAILPIVKKYGACVIGLTLDDEGIPSSADGRFEIAQKIVKTAVAYGIPKENIIIDCLALTASAQQAEVFETLKTIERVKKELGVCTALGVSNVSFGLPAREVINQTFLTMALYAGLDAPIINPAHEPMKAAIAAYEVLSNKDQGSERYINRFNLQQLESKNIQNELSAEVKLTTKEHTSSEKLSQAIQSGRKVATKDLTRELLSRMEPLAIVDEIIIPSLNTVGKKYEEGILFLPQLIQSAESVQGAFELLKDEISKQGKAPIDRGKIVLATVHHDIHDIGKNILKVVLENYGYKIYDLGKDVPPAKIVDACTKNGIKLVGLSALMTTTVASMTETIKQLKAVDGDIITVVGGAVLSAETALEIGADYYAKDASEMIKIAESVLEG
ncbi:homocysteine S-methyltransferase family protein [Fusibacter bizertensis]|uniref:Methionine synthase n=1 Tax=Fusibacter bizertensis TaxID=1488331 RepID=A0ABT6N9Q7_9FIRM|nr:homocysteine S-methyltransferase family protein [Fusibacter bizertensis]MDH8677148.1 homocysteine S-methyltransferase family protein [Fusibacter bizertensis]